MKIPACAKKHGNICFAFYTGSFVCLAAGLVAQECSCDVYDVSSTSLTSQCGPRQAKKGLQTCAYCKGSESSRAFAKSYPGIFSPLIHSIWSSDSVSGQ